MGENPAELAIGVAAGTMTVLFGLLILGALASSPAAPAPGDPMYNAFDAIVQNVPRALGLVGLCSVVAICGWIFGEMNSW